jgi:pimeloyl-ACP methyl ester carboxylesterase
MTTPTVDDKEPCMLKFAVATLIGAVCLQAAIAAAADPTPAPALHDCRLEHPLRLRSEEARCTSVIVPENRARPDGPGLELAIALVPALDRRSRAAPLFVLAGGPGQSAIDLYTSFAGAFARINREHDLVLLDQRGTGRSAPLSCAMPPDWSPAADQRPELRRATRACLEKYGDRVRYYTTHEAVLDLDQVRRALGYASIDLYGASYGTRVAELYMRRFPSVVHAAILDGVTDPQRPIGPDTPQDGERALQLIMARCEEARDCAEAYPALAGELADLEHRYGPERVKIEAPDPDSGLPTSLEFDRTMFDAALRFFSYSAGEASLLPGLIHEAATGNPGPLASQAIMSARALDGQIAVGMQNTVLCSEDVPFFPSDDALHAASAGTYQGSDQVDALRDICAIWPSGPVDADLHAALRSDVPTLLLSGEADPVTPPSAAQRLARTLTHYRHVIVSGEGHGQLATGCIPRLMARFLEAPAPERLDTSCIDGHRAPPFFVNSTGPTP